MTWLRRLLLRAFALLKWFFRGHQPYSILWDGIWFAAFVLAILAYVYNDDLRAHIRACGR